MPAHCAFRSAGKTAQSPLRRARAHGGKAAREVHHFRLARRVLEQRDAFRERRGHHQVLGAGDGDHVHDDARAAQPFGARVHVAMVDADGGAHRLQALDVLVDRPLADGAAGMRNWIAMFGSDYFAKLILESREVFLQRVEELLGAELFRDGQWWADYRRLRFAAWK